MAKVIPGRFTAQIEGPFVVFIIGMRVNKFFAFRKWFATAMAMRPMIRTLYEHPEKGFLGAQTFLYGRGVVTVQYWRSFEDLERFGDDAHSQTPPLAVPFPDTCSSEASVYVPRPGDHKGPLSYYDEGAAAPAARSHSKGRGGRRAVWGPLWLPWGGVGLLARPIPTCVRERALRPPWQGTHSLAHAKRRNISRQNQSLEKIVRLRYSISG
jgi:hypothetical protein